MAVRLYVILARAAPMAVVFRRGPSARVLLLKWRTDTDTFEEGQWLGGRIYERRGDLTPNGNYLVYFAAKYKTPMATWTAVSRPPWLTAVALWPKGDAWGGGGLWDDERILQVNHRPTQMKLGEGFTIPKRIRVSTPIREGYGEGEDFPIWGARLHRDGWTCTSPGESKEQRLNAKLWMIFDPPMVWEKPRPGAPKTKLRMIIRGLSERGGAWYATDHEVMSPGVTRALPGTSWADWDRNGDLLYTEGGGIFRFRLGKDEAAKKLVDLSGSAFVNRRSPGWAREWFARG